MYIYTYTYIKEVDPQCLGTVDLDIWVLRTDFREHCRRKQKKSKLGGATISGS